MTHEKTVSVIFNTVHWSVLDSANFLLNHGFNVIKIETTDTSIEYLQESPKTLKRKGYTELRTQKLGRGIEQIIAYKKPTTSNIATRS